MAELPLTRASLLVRLRDSHDQAAWNEFVDVYAPLVYGYLRKQRLQDADAADICQEVLRAVAGAVGRLDYDPWRGAFRNWLFTIVRRKLWNWQQRQASHARGSGDTGVQHALEHSPSPDTQKPEWEAEWQRRTFAWACEQVRPKVTTATWQAFWRTAVGAEPGQQVAADLGMTVTAVYIARSRVTARLKELVQSLDED
jgi:RNA polymerase sigma-70 factor (ECF subfamily)